MLRIARWCIVAAGSVVVCLGVVAALASRTPVMRDQFVSALSSRLNADVELGGFAVSAFPALSVDGDHLVVRPRGRRDVPPLIAIGRFHADAGLVGLFSTRRRFRTVHLDGLEITIPPDDGSEARRPELGGVAESRAIIDLVLSHDAKLTILPGQPGKEPKVFFIRDLTLTDVGFDRAMPFNARLTNPTPRGDIDASGTFGPWRASHPGQTPVAGRYSFKNVDLGTIEGIGGTLESTGAFTGVLQRIGVQGTTTTPDFSLDVGGSPLPLSTRFDATVDGMSGDTILNTVDARLGRTPIVARGAIVRRPGVTGRTVELDARIDAGRIEDALDLAVNSPKPLLTGSMDLTTTILLPPGEASVSDRLRLDGRFSLTKGRFEGPVQQKLVALSRRGRGLDPGDPAGRVLSDLRGAFRLRSGLLSFSRLAFRVPGALVRVKGAYGLRTQALDFTGELRMTATVSQAAGGWKSVLLKPFDPLFRKDGAGAVVPIRITGSRENPDVALDYRRVLKRH